MKHLSDILSLALVAIVCAACSGRAQTPESTLSWPRPPDRARIRFEYAITGKQDVVGEKSWLRKVIDVVFGEDRETGHLLRPHAIAVDRDGRLYVTDTRAGGIHVFDREERDYRFITRDGGPAFISPVGIAIAPDGTIYCADADLHEVLVLDHEGEYLFSISSGLVRPTGVWISGGILFVSDAQAHQVVVYDLQGKERYRIGRRGTASGEFNFPLAVCSDPATRPGESPDLYVVDAMNCRVQSFRKDGGFVSMFGKPGDAVGDFARPKGIAIDSEGHIYVADALFDVIQVFDRGGRLLLSFGGSGSGIGTFSLPAGLAIDSRDRLYVVDSANRRVQVFQYLK